MATTTRQDVARTLEEGDRGSSPLKQPAKPKQGSLFSRERALGPVTNDYGDLALLACSFVTGMVDAASFSNWAVFCGMQTGKHEPFSFFYFMRVYGKRWTISSRFVSVSFFVVFKLLPS